jgi:hypothetical protein
MTRMRLLPLAVLLLGACAAASAMVRSQPHEGRGTCCFARDRLRDAARVRHHHSATCRHQATTHPPPPCCCSRPTRAPTTAATGSWAAGAAAAPSRTRASATAGAATRRTTASPATPATTSCAALTSRCAAQQGRWLSRPLLPLPCSIPPSIHPSCAQNVDNEVNEDDPSVAHHNPLSGPIRRNSNSSIYSWWAAAGGCHAARGCSPIPSGPRAQRRRLARPGAERRCPPARPPASAGAHARCPSASSS